MSESSSTSRKQSSRFKLLWDLGLLSGGEICGKVVTFAAFAYLARKLGPDEYGVVEFTVSLSFFFGIIVDCGLGPIGVRELAGDRDKASSLAAGIPAAKILVALLVVPIMGLAVPLAGYTGDAAWLIWLFAAALLAAPWNQQWLMQGLEMMGGAAVGQLLRTLLFTSGILLFVRKTEDFWAVGMVEIVAASTLAAYYLCVQQIRIAPVGLSFQMVRGLLREGFSLGLANMCWAFHQCVPVFLVGLLVGGSATAWYGSAHRIVFSILGFSALYFFNLYPALARRLHADKGMFEELLQSSYCVVAWTTIFLSLLITIFSRQLMVGVFGAPFGEASIVLSILIWAVPSTMLSGHARWSLVAAGAQGDILVAQFVGATTTLIVGWVLVPLLDASGAALATLLASYVIWGVAHWYATQRLGSLPLLSVLRPAAVAGVCGLLGYQMKDSGYLAPSIAAAVFLVWAPIAEPRLFSSIKRLALAKSDSRPLTSAEAQQ